MDFKAEVVLRNNILPEVAGENRNGNQLRSTAMLALLSTTRRSGVQVWLSIASGFVLPRIIKRMTDEHSSFSYLNLDLTPIFKNLIVSCIPVEKCWTLK